MLSPLVSYFSYSSTAELSPDINLAPHPLTSSEDREVEDLPFADKCPIDLNCSVYRNGPGSFNLFGRTIRSINDGNGMIRKYCFNKKRVQFSNRYIQTEKYLLEKAAGKQLYPTWSTPVSSSFRPLALPHPKGESAVSIFNIGERLLSFGEGTGAWEIGKEDLETKNFAHLSGDNADIERDVYGAHPKFDADSKQWFTAGLKFGRKTSLHLNKCDQQGRQLKTFKLTLAKASYIHDFFMSQNFIIIVLPPIRFQMVPFLAGIKTFQESMLWRDQQDSDLLVFDKKNLNLVKRIKVHARMIWHTIDARDKGSLLELDFIGYDNSRDYFGSHNFTKNIIQGQPRVPRNEGDLQRYQIDLNTGRSNLKTLLEYNSEFPVIRESERFEKNKTVFFNFINRGHYFYDGLASFNNANDRLDQYSFKDQFVSEPMLINQDGQEYLFCEVYGPKVMDSFIALFRSEDLASGPVFMSKVPVKLPLTFHGQVL
jgi:all-trans-8'-apo-beta-carotenal 15,15'-oxygenase